MDPFIYRNGELHAEGVPLSRIARVVGTPFYCYSSAHMRAQLTAFREALSGLDATVYYALKANSNQAVIATFAALGAGADVVSLGEMRRALAAGVPADRIVFSGVGKSREEMAAALEEGIHQINVESEPELRALSEVAESRGTTAAIALRVNPDVDARTHHKITTGRHENKFGVPHGRAREVYALAARLPGLRVVGVAMHIGSQLTSIEPFEAAFRRMAELVGPLRADGHAIERLDLGGGLGIAYRGEAPPSLKEYGEAVRRTVGGLGAALGFEPGRLLVGNAGVLVARVIYDKREGRRFVIVDAAMNDLIRPTLYDAHHEIVPVRAPAVDAVTEPADVVGPVCESGDIFASQRPLPPVAPDELIAFRSAGAYGAVMASSYNSRPLAPEVLVDGGRFAVVRARPPVEALIGADRLPPWLEPADSRRVVA